MTTEELYTALRAMDANTPDPYDAVEIDAIITMCEEAPNVLSDALSCAGYVRNSNDGVCPLDLEDYSAIIVQNDVVWHCDCLRDALLEDGVELSQYYADGVVYHRPRPRKR